MYSQSAWSTSSTVAVTAHRVCTPGCGETHGVFSLDEERWVFEKVLPSETLFLPIRIFTEKKQVIFVLFLSI